MVETQIPEAAVARRAARMKSVLLVLACTAIGAIAQILLKIGANHMTHFTIWELFRNFPLFAGYCLYGLNTLLLVLALKDGELSALYPIIALTYVWVVALSGVIFHEFISTGKLAGVLIIVAGVTLLGKASRNA